MRNRITGISFFNTVRILNTRDIRIAICRAVVASVFGEEVNNENQ